MNAKLTTDGAIVLPSRLRRQDQIRAGERFEIERLAAGQYLLIKQPDPQHRANTGFVDWLLSCPEKGWFQPMRNTESTDTLFKEPLFEADVPRQRRKPVRKAKSEGRTLP